MELAGVAAQGPSQSRTRRQHRAQPTPPRHTNREPCPYPRKPAIYHPPRNPRRPAPTPGQQPPWTRAGPGWCGPSERRARDPAAHYPPPTSTTTWVYAVDDNDKCATEHGMAKKSSAPVPTWTTRPALRGDARRLLSPRTWMGPGSPQPSSKSRACQTAASPRQRGGRTAGLALPAPSRARMPDGQDIAAGGRVQPARARDRLHAQTAHRLQKKHLPTSPSA